MLMPLLHWACLNLADIACLYGLNPRGAVTAALYVLYTLRVGARACARIASAYTPCSY